jgi:pimeloyl-ACP methyl ester carboxylesterase
VAALALGLALASGGCATGTSDSVPAAGTEGAPASNGAATAEDATSPAEVEDGGGATGGTEGGQGGDAEGRSAGDPTASDAASAAGDLVAVAKTEVPGVDGWTVRYLSTGVHGDLVEVTGLVLAPEGTSTTGEGSGGDGSGGDGSGSLPVISWAHGTTGVADACAPSARPRSVSRVAVELAKAGHVVAVTDYEGLGTEGTHPYLVGPSEGRSTIDIVRAVASMEIGADVASTGRYAVAGLSQGGHAALWAGQLAPTYAPELDLVGVVAAAPATGITDLMRTVGSPAQGFAVMAAVAYDAAYEDVSLGDYFSPDAIEAMDVVHTGCNAEVFAAFLLWGRDAMIDPDGWDGTDPVGPLARRLAENEPGGAPVGAPVLLVQGDADLIVPPGLVGALHRRYCDGTTDAEYRLYPGGGHGDTVVSALDEVVAWLGERFAGVEPTGGCSGTAEP